MCVVEPETGEVSHSGETAGRSGSSASSRTADVGGRSAVIRGALELADLDADELGLGENLGGGPEVVEGHAVWNEVVGGDSARVEDVAVDVHVDGATGHDAAEIVGHGWADLHQATSWSSMSCCSGGSMSRAPTRTALPAGGRIPDLSSRGRAGR